MSCVVFTLYYTAPLLGRIRPELVSDALWLGSSQGDIGADVDSVVDPPAPGEPVWNHPHLPFPVHCQGW